jgi:hypothetical protein
MDMRGIRKDNVVRWLTKHGGKMLDLIPDRSGGPDWDGFRYLVGRASPAPPVRVRDINVDAQATCERETQ